MSCDSWPEATVVLNGEHITNAKNAVLIILLVGFMAPSPKCGCLTVRQLGDLRVLREVFHGFSKEARTRGFPSPSFGGFGFVVIYCRPLIRISTYKI